MKRTKALRWWLLAAALLTTLPRPALANGVSDSRVSLPDGPGSIAGIGENLEIDPNMGQMRYQVEIPWPQGFADNTPALKLGYSSGNGASVVGLGWDLPVPSIERATNRGLPRYTTEDRFAADGGTELVEVATGEYRARFEKDFVRYTWRDRGDGRGGYFTAEYPDGRVGYFGADRNGTLVTSRIEGEVDGQTGNVFSYLLVDMVDVHGHVVHYEYDRRAGNLPLLSRVSYVYEGDTPRYTAEFDYAQREDVISDCMPGFELLTEYRLSKIVIRSHNDVLSTMQLSYEDYADAGGASRLTEVRTYGAEGGLYPAVQRFGYSKSLGAICDGDCAEPKLVSMGQVAGAAGMISGQATFADMNGDGLPDLVASNATGAAHTIFMSHLDEDLQPAFAKGVASAIATENSGWDFSEPSIQAFDVDGDGRTDVYDRVQGRALCNTGKGDWSTAGCLVDPTADASFVDDADDADGAEDPAPLNIRFLDYDGDKRIDWIRTDSAESAMLFRNGESGFESGQPVAGVGFLFDNTGVDTVQATFADMNGDGLQDPAQISVTGGVATVSYRLNLGFARWGAQRTVSPVGSVTESARWELEDVNGDGLDDLVAVVGSEVHFALNRNGNQFDAFTVIGAGDGFDINVAGLPARGGDTTVLFADMNGNGTTDVVWLQPDGDVSFLDFSPIKPNLLSRIDNSLGHIQTVAYGTAAEQRALAERSGEPWARNLQMPMNVVVEKDTWVSLTGSDGQKGLHEIETFRYRDGAYDGVNKHFRGFAEVDRTLIGSDSQESGETRLRYDPADDPYRNGLLLSEEVVANPGKAERLLRRTVYDYADCPLDAVPDDLAVAVRFVCEQSMEETLIEGSASSEWATRRTDQTYDGFGNVTLREEHGVTAIGGSPCDDDCTGDELTTETIFLPPGASQAHPWLLNLPERMASWGHDGTKTDTRYYYDGPDFVGLPGGEADRGLLTRKTEAVSGDEVINAERLAYDGHGNVVASIDPNGDAELTDAHRRDYTYTSDGLKVARVEVQLTDPEGKPYQLRRDISYHSIYNVPTESTDWMTVQGGELTSSRNVTAYAYDEFQRITALARPGDSIASATQVISYDLGAPVSAIISRKRSKRGGELDLETVNCYDGRGRQVQVRTHVADARYQVTGFTEYNSRGAIVRSLQPFVADGAACDMQAPDSAVAYSMRYDAVGREIERTYPDADLYGTASTSRTEYLPLGELRFDEEDTDPSSPHYNTPTVTRRDGLDRIIEVVRYLDDYDQTVGEAISVAYDGLGRMVRYTDPEGHDKTATYDLLGRTLEVSDPNAGVTQFEYDPAGNPIARTDARGVRTELRYDGNNRRIARFEAEAPELGTATRYDFAPDNCEDCTHLAGRVAERTFALFDGSEARRRYGYDPRGREASVELQLHGHKLPTLLGYDNVDRLVETRFPDGQVERIVYDAGSRMIAIDGVIDAVDYSDRNEIASIEFANGATRTTTHDARLRLASLTTVAGDGTVISDYSYDRDRVGNLRQIDNRAEGAAALRQDFVYDDWYRTVTAVFTAGDGGEAETLETTYDGIDNVLSRVSSAGTDSRAHLGKLDYAGAQPSAVTHAGGVARAYDAAGQLTERGDMRLSWDYRGQLTTLSDGGRELGFSYDADGVELGYEDSVSGASNLFVGPNFEVRDGIGIWYARLGMHRFARSESDALAPVLFADADDDGHIDARDAFRFAEGGGDTAVSKTMLRSAARRVLMEQRGGMRFLHQDDIYSVVAATDAEGAVMGSRSYYPDGALHHSQGTVDEHGFTGQRAIEGTDLVRFRYRVLDAQSGRWLSPDPDFELLTERAVTTAGEGIDAYAYIAGHGVNGYDPDGLGNPKKKSKTPSRKQIQKNVRKAEKKAAKQSRETKNYAAFSADDHARPGPGSIRNALGNEMAHGAAAPPAPQPSKKQQIETWISKQDHPEGVRTAMKERSQGKAGWIGVTVIGSLVGIGGAVGVGIAGGEDAVGPALAMAVAGPVLGGGIGMLTFGNKYKRGKEKLRATPNFPR